MKNTFRQNSAQKNKTEFFWKNQFFMFSFFERKAQWDGITFELAFLCSIFLFAAKLLYTHSYKRSGQKNKLEVFSVLHKASLLLEYHRFGLFFWKQASVGFLQVHCPQFSLIHVVHSSFWIKKNRESDNEGKFHMRLVFVTSVANTRVLKNGQIFSKIGKFTLTLFTRKSWFFYYKFTFYTSSLSLACFFFNRIEFWTMCIQTLPVDPNS